MSLNIKHKVSLFRSKEGKENLLNKRKRIMKHEELANNFLPPPL